MTILYLIDGVRVPKKIWERRQGFGEYCGANFWTDAIVPHVPKAIRKGY